MSTSGGNDDFTINVVDYNAYVPFNQQLNITHNTDIFMGRFFVA